MSDFVNEYFFRKYDLYCEMDAVNGQMNAYSKVIFNVSKIYATAWRFIITYSYILHILLHILYYFMPIQSSLGWNIINLERHSVSNEIYVVKIIENLLK